MGLFEDILAHAGHNIEVGLYVREGTVYNAALECVDCNVVIVDEDNPNIEWEKP